MANKSVSLHRVLKASPEKVYRAFTEPEAMESWLPSYGFLCTVEEMNVRVGGAYKMTFHNFSTGSSHSFGGKYIDIITNEFLQYTDQFDDSSLPVEMVTSVWLKKVSVGTEIKFCRRVSLK